jgi:HNH endonuclease
MPTTRSKRKTKKIAPPQEPEEWIVEPVPRGTRKAKETDESEEGWVYLTGTMPVPNEFGTADDYLRALQAVLREGVPEKHLDMLREHFRAPDHTTSWEQLADKVGYRRFSAVNMQYGTFAHRVASQLGQHEQPEPRPGEGFWVWVLVHWADKKDAKGHTRFILRPEVVEALKRLGWDDESMGGRTNGGRGTEEPPPEPEPESESEERRWGLPEKVWQAITVRKGQPEFREQLLRAYGRRCAVTGCDAEDALEAAHIRGYAETGEQDVRNGLLLRADIHTLFDLDLVRIDPGTLRVALAPGLRETCYRDLQGRKLRLPEQPADQPSRDALRERWEGGQLA